uniref:ATP synthase F0 subunit 8 n=1 Tax=Scolytoplatypus sinensis TaxID=1041105 RepID=UPI0023AAC446|nr:ATP synthase F0 subunit 8 [Scolytoplatypus sinensis]WCB99764.1 ATP synthase F0 subunit 8 [Scolytoplatypus sinensis]
MPQMAPMSWVSLSIMFLLLFYLYMIVCFFSLSVKPLNSKTESMSKARTLNWKW